jgi:hypothetical protein
LLDRNERIKGFFIDAIFYLSPFVINIIFGIHVRRPTGEKKGTLPLIAAKKGSVLFVSGPDEGYLRVPT